MRVLVTGSSGQLGTTIVEMLAQGHSVNSFDLIPGAATSEIGSVTDRDFVFSRMEDVDAVIHIASLHARHLHSHSKSEFVSVNVQGTLNLLEAAVAKGVKRFVYTSTTSLYGHAMVPGDRAAWVTESLTPQPRDIYDVTKIAAENLCKIFSEQHALPCISLRVSRFFPEPENLTAIYRLYRGVDVRDAAAAHLLALQSNLSGFEVFNISAHSPFQEHETESLLHDARSVIVRHYPTAASCFVQRGWDLPNRIDRVYVTEKAEKLLKYRPRYNFADVYLKMD